MRRLDKGEHSTFPIALSRVRASQKHLHGGPCWEGEQSKKIFKKRSAFWSTKPEAQVGLDIYSGWMKPLCLATWSQFHLPTDHQWNYEIFTASVGLDSPEISVSLLADSVR